MSEKKSNSKGRKMNKYYIPLLIFILIVGFYYLGSQYLFKKQAVETVSPKTNETKEPEKSELTMLDVAKHANAEDCWLVIDKKVYNATSYIANHSGGAKNITDYCGKDASAAWNTKNKAVAKLHSEAAKALLNKNLVGELSY